MAKIYGLFGSMTGKVADVVMAVRNGEQIARKYQPIISNPKSDAQVASRAKLKLMSQLSAVMAPVIALPRQGSVSSRNMFVKKNYMAATYADSQADITLTNVKLTDSVVSLPNIASINRGDTSGINVHLSGVPFLDVNRVVYAMFIKQEDGTLRYFGSRVISDPGDSNIYTATFPYTANECVFYAYGVRDNTEAARIAFGNMQAVTAETVAKLITSKTLLASDITLTETRAAILAAGGANAAMSMSPEEEMRQQKKTK